VIQEPHLGGLGPLGKSSHEKNRKEQILTEHDTRISNYVIEQSVYQLQTPRNSKSQINLTVENSTYKDVPVLNLFRISDATAVRLSAEG
jgi:hypothetical protein